MTTLLSASNGFVFLLIFAFVMLTVTLSFARRFGTKSVEGFLVVNRIVPWWLGGPSIAASWTWVIALMVSVQLAYENGFAGAFWFTVPNVAAVLLYLWLAPLIRAQCPYGLSLPEWLHVRFQSDAVTYLYLLVCGFYQIMAVTVQVYAGSHLFSVATGIPATALMPLFVIVTLMYTLISGLEASVVTDLLQFTLLLVCGGAIVGGVVYSTGGTLSFAGTTGHGGANPFSPSVLLTIGIINTIALLSGSLGDQALWQRAFALKETDLRKGILLGAGLFALVPIGLSFLGFTAAAPSVGLKLPPDFDGSLVGFAIVKHLLSPGMAVLFLFVLLVGLNSSLDSGLNAWSSIMALFHTKSWKNSGKPVAPYTLTKSRINMAAVSIIGLSVAYAVEYIPGFSLKYLFWFLNTTGASIAVPTLLSLAWPRLTARGVLIGSITSLCIGLPLVAYSSVTGNDALLASTYVAIVIINIVSCFSFADRSVS